MPSGHPLEKSFNEIDCEIYYLWEIKECSFIALLKYSIIFYLLECQHEKS